MFIEKIRIMETLKYTVIKNDIQYLEYCDVLEWLLKSGKKSQPVKDEVELLTMLLEKWDRENNSLNESNPVELLKFLMDEHDLKSSDLATILDVSKGLVSDILRYKKG